MGVYTARRSRDRSLLVYMCALPIELPRAYPLPAVPPVPHFSEQVIGMDLQSNPFGRSAVLHSELMQPPPPPLLSPSRLVGGHPPETKPSSDQLKS